MKNDLVIINIGLWQCKGSQSREKKEFLEYQVDLVFEWHKKVFENKVLTLLSKYEFKGN